MTNLTIIDTGCANLSSVKFAFDRLGIRAEISRDLNKIQSADKLLLPVWEQQRRRWRSCTIADLSTPFATPPSRCLASA